MIVNYPNEVLSGYTGRSGYLIEGVTTNKGVATYMKTERDKQVPTHQYAYEIVELCQTDGRIDYEKFGKLHPNKDKNGLSNIVSRVYKKYTEALESGELTGKPLAMAKYIVEKWPDNARKSRASSMFGGWDNFDFDSVEEDNLG